MQAHTMTLDNHTLAPFHLRLMVLVFGAHLIDGYALGIISYVIVSINLQIPLTAFEQGYLGSSALLGLFIGSLIFGRIADKIGRNLIFITSFILITLASVAQYFADSIVTIALLRVLLGVGIGGDYTVGLTLLAEFTPKRYRSVILSLFSVVWTIGYVLATQTGEYMSLMDNEPWRLMLALTTFPAILILIFRIGMPESPRWLLSRGRVTEAKKIINTYLGEQAYLEYENSQINYNTPVNEHLFSAKIWRNTLFSSIFFICIVIPYFAIYTFLPTIIAELHIPKSLNTELFLNIFLILGALIGIYLAYKLSRRTFTLGSFLLLALCLLILSTINSTLIMVSVFLIFTLTMSAISNLTGVYPPECFPTHLRSTGVGFATAVSRVGAAIGTFLLPLAVNNIGINISLILLSGVLFIGAIVTYYWAPETKHQNLK